jgi:hypothetical protein
MPVMAKSTPNAPLVTAVDRNEAMKTMKRVRMVDQEEKAILARFDQLIAEIEGRKSAYVDKKKLQNVLRVQKSNEHGLVMQNQRLSEEVRQLKKQLEVVNGRLEFIRNAMR